MSGNSQGDSCELVQHVLANLGRRESTAIVAFEELSRILGQYLEATSRSTSAANYVQAAAELKDASFPSWPLKGTGCDLSSLSLDEGTDRKCARAIGIYLSVAIEKAEPFTRRGAKRLFQYLQKSGLFPTDVLE